MSYFINLYFTAKKLIIDFKSYFIKYFFTKLIFIIDIN